jgi:L-rhamnose mutarotase
MEYPENINYQSFKRYCKVLDLYEDPELIAEYIHIHSPGVTWPEIAQGMKDVGILDMEIYITGNKLFMIMDTVPDFDHDKAMKELATKPRQKEWEKFVARFQKTTETASADEKWTTIQRIFKMK